jgi:hypothetical protein
MVYISLEHALFKAYGHKQITHPAGAFRRLPEKDLGYDHRMPQWPRCKPLPEGVREREPKSLIKGCNWGQGQKRRKEDKKISGSS